MKLFFSAILSFFILNTSAQKITYAEILEEDLSDLNFEIIGRQGGMNVIYKNSKAKHYLSYYNTKMDVVKQVQLPMLNSKTRAVDFISYPDKIWLIYQYKEENSFVCEAVSISNDGVVDENPIQLDAVKSASAGSRVYNISHSEDKSKILVYKLLLTGDSLIWTNRIFDPNLNLLDFSNHKLSHKKDKNSFSDAVISNDGIVAMGLMQSKANKDKASLLNIIYKTMDAYEWTVTDISKEGVFIDEMMAKVDNINKRFVFVSLYAKTARGFYEGVFSATVPFADNSITTGTFNFPEVLRKKFNTGASDRKSYEYITINQVVIKKDGGLLITAEENLTVRSGRRYSRYNSMNNYDMYPYGYSDYYSPYYARPYYRGYPGYYPYERTEYEYQSNNILLISLNNQLEHDWNTLVEKNQREINSSQAISHGVMNSGGMFHFLYTIRNRNMISIGHSSIKPSGEYNSFPNITFRQRNAEVMPRFAKQVGYADVIIPYQINNHIGFVLLEF